MNCVKCGQEVSAGQAFCETCLDEMARHPVKPGTVVLLPRNTFDPVVKRPFQRKRPSAEEQVVQLKKKLRRTRWLAVLLALLVIASGLIAYSSITQLDIQKLWGQNYTTVTSMGTTTEPDTQGTLDMTIPK